MQRKTILVTGGLGFIGSHTAVELLESGFDVVVVDNLCNSERGVLERIGEIAGRTPTFYEGDLCDLEVARRVFREQRIEVVIHFAALKAVGESVKEPLRYFQNNLGSLMNVLKGMQEAKVRNLIFSSSATVYGEPSTLPVTEAFPFPRALSAYGSTKQIGEEMLEKVTRDGAIRNISLRYFNPVGAHASALIGELPLGTPNNLFPYVMQTAAGLRPQLTIFGNDYATPDGTCLRDYIHVVDLAKAHVLACQRLLENRNSAPFEVFNLGTGAATSVLEIVKTFERVTGVKLKYAFGPRREGDVTAVYADTTRANQVLGWKAQLGLEHMLRSSWKWQERQRKDRA